MVECYAALGELSAERVGGKSVSGSADIPRLCPSYCVVPIVAARALRAYVANARARRRSWGVRGAKPQSLLEAVSSARSGARLLPGRAFAVHARARTRWGCHRAVRRDVPAGAQRVPQQHPCGILAGELEHDSGGRAAFLHIMDSCCFDTHGG